MGDERLALELLDSNVSDIISNARPPGSEIRQEHQLHRNNHQPDDIPESFISDEHLTNELGNQQEQLTKAIQIAQQMVFFKYCRMGADHQPRRDEAFEIQLIPNDVLDNSVAIYNKADIISAIENDLGVSGQISSVKYYDSQPPTMSWREIQQNLQIKLNIQYLDQIREDYGNFFPSDKIVIELLIKERPLTQNQSSFNGPAIGSNVFTQPVGFMNRVQSVGGVSGGISGQINQNQFILSGFEGVGALRSNSVHSRRASLVTNHITQEGVIQQEWVRIQEFKDLQDLVNTLKSKVSDLEKKFDEHLRSPLLTSDLSKIHREQSVFSCEDLKQKDDPFFQVQPRVNTNPSNNGKSHQNNNISPNTMDTAGALRLSPEIKYVCSGCHSEIMKEDIGGGLCKANQGTSVYHAQSEKPKLTSNSAGQKNTLPHHHQTSTNLMSQIPHGSSSIYAGSESNVTGKQSLNKGSSKRKYEQESDSSLIEDDEENDVQSDNEHNYDSSDNSDQQRQSLNTSYKPKKEPSQNSGRNKKNLDMAFLFANPLMRYENGVPVPFPAPLDTEKEFNQLCRYLQDNNPQKQFVVKREAANYDSLDQIILEKPTILHISCHGDSYFDGKKNIFYLAFEDLKERGFMKPLDEGNLKELLCGGGSSQEQGNNNSDCESQIKVVFVSACHSEMIGQLFKRVNVPVVIAVSQHTQILDEVAGKFAQHFYDLLLKGNTIRNAFQKAKSDIRGSSKTEERFSCCCSHYHSSNCPWKKYGEQNGWEKACQLHSPTCFCPKKFIGKHSIKCKVYEKFHQELKTGPFDEDMDISFKYLGLKEGSLCCCKEDTPHNEDAKFMIVKRPEITPMPLTELIKISKETHQDLETVTRNQRELESIENDKRIQADERDEKELDVQLFQHLRQKKSGRIQIQKNMQNLNFMPKTINELLVVARNNEVQQIVQHLDHTDEQTRLIHINGERFVGKSAIALYSAKYALDRNIFPAGVYYVDLKNKTQEHSFIDAIYERLKLSKIGQSLDHSSSSNLYNSALSNIIQTIMTSRMLIIIENCQGMIEESKQEFNEALKKLAEEPHKIKIIVVTQQRNDIIPIQSIWQLQIKDLSKKDASLLLWTAAQEVKTFTTEIKDLNALRRHPIFQGSTDKFKPHSILEIVQHLREGKNLTDIFKEQQEAREIELKLNKESENAQASILGTKSIISAEENAYCWTLNMTYREVKAKYTEQISLLLLMCQFPNGLFDSDIKILCTKLRGPPIETFYSFLGQITQIVSQEGRAIQESENQVGGSRSSYIIVTAKSIEELGGEYYYLPLYKFSEYINSFVITEPQKKEYFKLSLLHLAKLSRQILRGIKYQYRNDLDIQVVSSAIDIGIWKDDQSHEPLKESEINEIISSCTRHDIKFKYNEANFASFLDIKILKNYISQKKDERSEYMKSIVELCINTISIYIMLDKKEDAEIIIKRARLIEEFYKNKFLNACLSLIECSRMIKARKSFSQIDKLRKNAQDLFHQLGYKDGEADSYYLYAIQLSNSIGQMIETLHSDNHHSFTLELNRQNSLNDFSSSSSQHHIHKMTRLQSQQFEHSGKGKFSTLDLQRQISNISQKGSIYEGGQMTTNSNQKQKRLMDEIENMRLALVKAKDIFHDLKNEFGIAKTSLILAEFYIEKTYGTGINIDIDSKQVETHLKTAREIFKKLRLEALEARCLSQKATFASANNDLFLAKEHIEAALKICEAIQDVPRIRHCSSILNEILDKIRIKYCNVFIFAKAFPLVEYVDKDFRQVGTFTKHLNDFRIRVQNRVKEINRVVNLKFDVLTKDFFDQIKTYGCRVLHLSSDVYKDDRLCIEGQNGQIEYIDSNSLRAMLKSKDNSPLKVDVVVLALPDSQKLAHVFVELGVPHVIAFEFSQKFSSTSFMDNVQFLPKRFSKIYNFCVEFYLNLIKQQTVQEALKNASSQFEDDNDEQNIDQYSQDSMNENEDFDIDEGRPILLPLNQNHKIKLFDQESPEEKKFIKDGPYIDSSKVRGPTNIIKLRPPTPFTGRQIEIFKVMNYIKNATVKMINVYGPSGIGKTRFLIETAYFMHARHDFHDGIFLIDVQKVLTFEQLKIKLQENNICGQDINLDLQNKKFLLILDNIDQLYKHSKTQFIWFLEGLFNYCVNVKVILTSKKDIRVKDFSMKYSNKEFKLIVRKLKPLNEIEAADLVLTSMQFQNGRTITKDELGMDEYGKRTVHQQLQQERRVMECCGFPKYLEQLAMLLKKKHFLDIKIEHDDIDHVKHEKMRQWQSVNEPSKNDQYEIKSKSKLTGKDKGKQAPTQSQDTNKKQNTKKQNHLERQSSVMSEKLTSENNFNPKQKKKKQNQQQRKKRHSKVDEDDNARKYSDSEEEKGVNQGNPEESNQGLIIGNSQHVPIYLMKMDNDDEGILHLPSMDLMRGQSVYSQDTESRSRANSELLQGDSQMNANIMPSQDIQRALQTINKYSSDQQQLKLSIQKKPSYYPKMEEVKEESEYSRSNIHSQGGGGQAPITTGESQSRASSFYAYSKGAADAISSILADEEQEEEDKNDEFDDEDDYDEEEDEEEEEDQRDRMSMAGSYQPTDEDLVSQLTMEPMQRYLSMQSSSKSTSFSGGRRSDTLSNKFSYGSGGGNNNNKPSLKQIKQKKDTDKQKAQIRQELGPRSGRKDRKFKKKTKNQKRERAVQNLAAGGTAVLPGQRKQEGKIKSLKKNKSLILKNIENGIIPEESADNDFGEEQKVAVPQQNRPNVVEGGGESKHEGDGMKEGRQRKNLNEMDEL